MTVREAAAQPEGEPREDRPRESQASANAVRQGGDQGSATRESGAAPGSWPRDRRSRRTSPLPPLPVLDLGVAPYQPVQDLQRRLRDLVAEGATRGVLLLLEHEPVITLGTRAGLQDLRSATALPRKPLPAIVESERGGQATLHAPGQLVSYPIIPIPGHDLAHYVSVLEEVLIVLLRDLDIAAERKQGSPGLYVDGLKIASVGLRCRRWVTSHGTSLNVDIDLDLFDFIVSCGDPDLRQTSIKELTGRAQNMTDIKNRYLAAAREVCGWEFLPTRTVSWDQVEGMPGLEMPTAGFEPATPGSGGQCSIP